MDKKKIHKHKWHFVKYSEPYKTTEGIILKGYIMFICECGLSKIVEPK